MYLEYFGLDDYPFDGLPDRRFYYVGGAQHQSLGLLTTALSRSGSICVLSGSSGAGKTTLVKMLMRSLPRRMRIISIDDPRLDPNMLLAVILRSSGVVATSLESIAELTLKLRQMLENSIAQGVITTVICDEAQGLSDEVLEQIRLISNIEGEAGKMINFLLVGQEDLINHLNKPEHDMLKNRIKIFAILPRLKEEEVSAYITYRIQQAGCMEAIFTNRAIAVLTKQSQGIPRLINAMADMCLTIACDKHKRQVNSFIAKRAANIVLYNQAGGLSGILQIFKELSKVSLYQKILTVVAAAGCAAGAYWGVDYMVKNYMEYVPNSLQVALMGDREIQENYQELTKELFAGRHQEGRELYLFNQAVNQAYFKSEAYATLLKLYGYALAGGDVVVSDKVLASIGLQCLEQTGSFSEAISFNAPILIGLLDDNLTPFYAVLYQINDDIAQLIIGNYMFTVKLSYIEERYQGVYTLLHPYIGNINRLRSNKTDVRKDMQNELRPYLEHYLDLALESANSETNVALQQLRRAQDQLNELQEQIKKQAEDALSEQGLDQGKSDAAWFKLVQAKVKELQPHNAEYVKLTEQVKQLEQVYELREGDVREIRSISLKLDGGFEKASDLFFRKQHLSQWNNKAAAILTLYGNAKGPKLINVVSIYKSAQPEQQTTPSTP